MEKVIKSPTENENEMLHDIIIKLTEQRKYLKKDFKEKYDYLLDKYKKLKSLRDSEKNLYIKEISSLKETITKLKVINETKSQEQEELGHYHADFSLPQGKNRENPEIFDPLKSNYEDMQVSVVVDLEKEKAERLALAGEENRGDSIEEAPQKNVSYKKGESNTRIRRREYNIIGFIIGMTLAGAAFVFQGYYVPIIAFSTIALISSIYFTIRRLHDIDRPWAHFLLLLVPFYGFYLALLLMFKPGTKGRNRFGRDPRR